MSTWRDAASPIIARVIAEVGTDDQTALTRVLRDAYPWGEKRGWPYKVWRDEIRRQLGRTRAKQPRGPREPARHEPLPGQLTLPGFDN